MTDISPEEAGFDPALLKEAIAFHIEHETAWPRSMMTPDGKFIGVVSIGDKPQYAEVLGPIRERGAPNGMILRHGKLVAEWGDTHRPDMTFSISKSYLAICAGLAVADGLISDLDQRVALTVDEPWFASEQNAPITWRNLLQLSSEWSGTLWGKPDVVDHNRIVGGATPGPEKGEPRALKPAGTHFEYNDVRVNLLAACLTKLFKRSLPDVLRERIMDKIGASRDWVWHGYDNSDVICDGKPVRSVSGGAHWGGGLFISSQDHALVGSLILADGLWKGERLLPEGWVGEMVRPSPINDQYGLFWWLNGGAKPRYASAPRESFFALGAGTSLIWIVPSLELVAVLRWIDGAHVDRLLGRITAALRA